jgi:hypothetical protein
VNITENTTYSVRINGTACPVIWTSLSGNVSSVTCTAPDLANYTYYDLELTANYTSPIIGEVRVRETEVNAVFYAPTVTDDDDEPGPIIIYQTGGGGGSYTPTVPENETDEQLVMNYQSISLEMFPGENVEVAINVKNIMGERATLTANSFGRTSDFINFINQLITLDNGVEGTINLNVFIPYDTKAGLYYGEIKVTSGDKESVVPVTVRVLESREKLLDIKIEPILSIISPGDMARFEVGIYNLGETKRVDIQLVIQIIDPNTDQVVLETEESIAIETSLTTIKSIKTNPDMPEGKYVVRAIAYYTNQQNNRMQASSIAYITIQMPWYFRLVFGLIPMWMFIIILFSAAGGLTGLRYYMILQMRKRRYKEKIDFRTLPQPGKRSAFIGKVAETAIRTFFPIDGLQTHTIVAGATGSGKTVAAQDMVEEVLMKGGSVLVFDPTAQWTGFMRKCEDRRMLSRYGQFEMKTKDAKPFKGSIRIVEDPHELIDIKKHMKPGEITVFAINKLSTKNIDTFVVNTIEQVFRANLDESQKTRLLMVYDEVHRLLPKFGGSGRGFIQIERGCREFRKWGVGMLLISQVLSDFVGEIKANIGTEIQMRTWYEGDLERIKMKYGEDISKSVVKEGIGTGMVVNSEYNKGRPYFVAFRPILHDFTRLSEKDLENYNKYNRMIEQMQYQLDQLKENGVDIFDIEIELKLARDKVSEGSFNMVDIYLESIQPKLRDKWTKLNKTPAKLEKQYASEEALERGVEEARKARQEYLEKEAKKPKKQEPAASTTTPGPSGTQAAPGQATPPEGKPVKEQSGTEKIITQLNDSFSELNKAVSDAKNSGRDVSEYEKRIKTIKPSVEMLEITEDEVKIKKIMAEIGDLIKIIKTNKQ